MQKTPANLTFTSNDGEYVKILRTTPVRTICPNFFLLDIAHGCGFSPTCSYCFLKDPDVYGFASPKLFTDRDRLLSELKNWIAQDNLETYLANAGNKTDSLAFEPVHPVWADLIECMRENAEAKGRPHTILAVTKAGPDCCEAFFSRPACRNVIVSFSINADDAARDNEEGAAPPAERLEAARMLLERGWRVRVRIDPMIKGYDYRELADKVAKLPVERVTLGTLRADPTLLPAVDHMEIFKQLDPPEEGSIARYPLAERLEMYKDVVQRLKGISVGLCEETPDVWIALGLDADNKTCNCNPDLY